MPCQIPGSLCFVNVFWPVKKLRLTQCPFSLNHKNGTKGEKGAWIRVSTTITCECGKKFEFPLNFKKLEHPLYCYGDDADRLLGPFSLHSYSIIGGTSGPINEMCGELNGLKKDYVKSFNPSDWRVHVTDMKNARKRITHAVYSHFKGDSLKHFFKDCANIFKSREQMTWNYHVTAIVKTPNKRKEKTKHLNEAKAVAHNALISQAIYMATKQNLRPLFTFDASKPVKRYPHIEGWSFDTYSNSRCYLAHAFLTHSNDIMPPKFVVPGSHPCLELADIHAYFAARSMYDKFQGDKPEIPLSDFGDFRYITVKHGGRIEFHTGSDIPVDWYPSK